MTRLVDLFDLPDWALAALSAAGLRDAPAVLARAACGRYGADGPVGQVAELLWDRTLYARPMADCRAAARVIVAACEGGAS